MKIDLRKTLMAGTAIVAASAFVVSAGSAQAQNITLGSSGIWASSGALGLQDNSSLSNAAANATVDLNNFTLTITDGAPVEPDTPAIPNDGSGITGIYNIGAITDGGAGGGVTIFNSTGGNAAGALNVFIASADVNGVFFVSSVDSANNTNILTEVAGALTVDGDLGVGSAEANPTDTDLIVNGTLTSNGVASIVGGGAATALAGMTVRGNAAFNQGLFMNEAAGGVTYLSVNSTSTQTVSGNILAVNDGDGRIDVGNTSSVGAIFTGDIGSIGAGANAIGGINLRSTGANVNATFRGNVDVGAIVLGDGAGTDTNTLTFNSTGNRTVTGTVDGSAGDTDNVIVSGSGGTLTAGAAWGGTSALDNLTIGSGATLAISNNVTATAISLTGTLQVTGGTPVIRGDITGGSGTLDIDADGTVRGSVINVTTVDIADGATLTIDAQDGNETYSATTTTINDAGEDDGIILDAAGNTLTVSGVIGTATAAQGGVFIADNAGAGTTAFTANLGTTSARLGVLDFVTGAQADAVTTTKSLYVDDIIFRNANDSLTFLGNGSVQYVSAAINGAGGNEGDIVVGNAGATVAPDVRFLGMIGQGNAVDTLTVHPSARAEFDQDATFNGVIQNDGTVQVNAGNTLAVGGYAAGAGAGTFRIGIDRTGIASTVASVVGTQTGNITGLGGVDISADTLAINVEGGVLRTETLASLITGVTVAPTITDTALYNFTGVINAGNLDVTVATVSVASLTTTGNNLTTANMLLTDPTLVASTDTTLKALQANLQNASSAAEFNEVLEQAQPTIDGSSFVAATAITNNSFNMMGDRLASLRTGDDVSGMTTGNVTQGLRAWTQAFGATGEQDSRGGIDGYDFDTYGVAVGLDTENIAEDTVLGLAFSYADTESDSNNASQTNTESDSYQITLYGDHDFQNDIYLNGMAAFTWTDAETSRLVAGATARGDYDVDQYTFRAEVGRDYAFEGATITPHALAHWTHFSPDSYTETGAGGAGLIVSPDNLNIVELGIGADVNWLFQNSDGSYFSPELSVGYRHDFADDNVEMTSRFIAGGAAFTTEGFDPQQDTIDLGAGFTYFSTDNWELTAEYDYEWKEDFDAHAGMVRAAYRF